MLRGEGSCDDVDPTIPVLACTATANQRVMADLAEQLGATPLLFRGSSDRESLRLSVLRIANQADRLAWLADRINRKLRRSLDGTLRRLRRSPVDRVGI
jgi:superfamily II DNA helicase RecQ